MLSALAKTLFGSENDRVLKRMQASVDAINALEPELEKLSDEELVARTPWLQERIKNGETLDDLLVDAFATVLQVNVTSMFNYWEV